MKKIVTIGGGTGSFVILRGLKKYPLDISAVVSTFDSGGSSGILRDQYGSLPPGDIRRALVALAPENEETVLRDLFSYRFADGSFKGHSFGNLLLTVLDKISGSFAEAVNQAGRILNIKGRVLPVSLDQAHLWAELENGEIIEGESNIDIPKHDASLKIRKVFLRPDVKIFTESQKVIEEANLIIVGPGDLYTSLIPNLLVSGMTEAIKKSRAKTVCVCNLLTKWGEAPDPHASVFVRELLNYAGLEKFDFVICNDKEVTEPHLSDYAEEKKFPLQIDDELSKYARQIIKSPLFKEAEVIRHDSEALSKIIYDIVEEN